MKGRDLIEALSFIDEKLVNEADVGRLYSRRWVRLAAMAACLCIILGSAYGLRRLQEPTEGISQPEMMPENLTEATQATEMAVGAEGSVDTASEKREFVVIVDEWTEDGFLATVLSPKSGFETGTQIEVRRMEGETWEIPEIGENVILHSYTYDLDDRIVYAKRIGKDE